MLHYLRSYFSTIKINHILPEVVKTLKTFNLRLAAAHHNIVHYTAVHNIRAVSILRRLYADRYK